MRGAKVKKRAIKVKAYVELINIVCCKSRVD